MRPPPRCVVRAVKTRIRRRGAAVASGVSPLDVASQSNHISRPFSDNSVCRRVLILYGQIESAKECPQSRRKEARQSRFQNRQEIRREKSAEKPRQFRGHERSSRGEH